MNYKEELLKNPHNSKLSYVGAALLGMVLNVMFHLVTGGQVLLGVGIYLIYVFFIMFIETLCKDGVHWACEFNEFWITLEELTKRKLGK